MFGHWTFFFAKGMILELWFPWRKATMYNGYSIFISRIAFMLRKRESWPPLLPRSVNNVTSSPKPERYQETNDWQVKRLVAWSRMIWSWFIYGCLFPLSDEMRFTAFRLLRNPDFLWYLCIAGAWHKCQNVVCLLVNVCLSNSIKTPFQYLKTLNELDDRCLLSMT